MTRVRFGEYSHMEREICMATHVSEEEKKERKRIK
jgi:hypothetical protein